MSKNETEGDKYGLGQCLYTLSIAILLFCPRLMKMH